MYPATLIAYVHYQKRSIGKFSSFGSLGWLAGYLLAALIENTQLLFAISSLFYCFALFSAFGLKNIEKPTLNVSYFSFDTFNRNIGMYLSFFIRHTGAVSVWTILPLYLIELGANTFWIGIIYAINPALQFLIMRRLEGLRNEKLVVWGYLLSALTFINYILAPSFPYIIPGMLLLGCSWSFLYVGSTQLVVDRNPDKATAAGLINSMIGAAGITGSLLGGMLLQVYGFKATMLAGAVLSLLSFVIFRLFDHPADELHNFNKIY